MQGTAPFICDRNAAATQTVRFDNGISAFVRTKQFFRSEAMSPFWMLALDLIPSPHSFSLGMSPAASSCHLPNRRWKY